MRELADQEFLCEGAIYAGRIAFQKAVCLRKTSLFWSGSACDALGNGDSRRRKLGVPAKILAERLGRGPQRKVPAEDLGERHG